MGKTQVKFNSIALFTIHIVSKMLLFVYMFICVCPVYFELEPWTELIS